MKNLSYLLLVSLAACSGQIAGTIPQVATCTDINQCTITCDGVKSCSNEGICECTRTQMLNCTDTTDCTITCDGVKSCSNEGICECTMTQVAICTDVSQCTSECDGVKSCSADGICECTITNDTVSATLVVNVEDDTGNLVAGTYTVTSAADSSITWSSVGSATFTNIPLGDYEIAFEHVTAMVTPEPITARLLAADGTVTENGVYMPSKLEVTSVAYPDITVVKGSKNNDAPETLTLRFEVTENILLNAFAVRFYADDRDPADIVYGAGTVPANEVISSAILMRGTDVISGPTGLQADLSHGDDTSAFNPGSADHYFATFASLGFTIPDTQWKNFTIKVNLLNTIENTVHIYAEVLMCSINAEDMSGNKVVAGGYTQTCPVHSMQLVTVITHGVLTASAENLPDGGIVIAGSSNNMASQYRFHAAMEAYEVNKLTVMNDADGVFDTPIATGAVNQITIRYPDENAVIQTRTASMAGGTATFSGLGMYVPKNGDAMLEIEDEATSMAMYGEALSGQTFRLGLQDQGNTISTFEAVGQSSSETDNFTDGDEIGNQPLVNTFVVRKTKLTFAKASGLSTVLINGNNRFFGFPVTADPAGAGGVGRFPFWIDKGDVVMRNFRFYRGSTDITDRVNIRSANGDDVSYGSGNDFTGNILMVSFKSEESVAAGAGQTYYLDGEASNVVANDFVQTFLLGFDNDDQLALSNSCHNPNTGRIYDTSGAGIFDSASDFSQATVPLSVTVVWSDKSSDTHSYPTVTNGDVIDGTGSCDWMGGHGLGHYNTLTHVLSS